MQGMESEYFLHFKKLMVEGFIALQKEYKKIVVLSAMMLSVSHNLPCFVDSEKILAELHFRLFPQQNGKGRRIVVMSEKEAENFINQSIFFII